MKKLNKNGFTLIELLAVIVILGVVMGIAIPSISSLINNTKKDAYIRTAQAFIGGVRNMAISDADNMLPGLSHKSYISLELVKLEKGGRKSPFGGEIDKVNSYVVIEETTGKVEDPTYTYSIIIAEETGKYGISNATNLPVIETELDEIASARKLVKSKVPVLFPAGTPGDIVCTKASCTTK